jgi:hypothetical protein
MPAGNKMIVVVYVEMDSWAKCQYGSGNLLLRGKELIYLEMATFRQYRQESEHRLEHASGELGVEAG